MKKNLAIFSVLLLILATPAFADSIYLKNGVRFDGVVTAVPSQEGLYRVQAGDRVVLYRESEIDRIEKNERTGHLNKDDLIRQWKERNEKLTEETGLTAEQRRQVRAIMFDLKSEDPAIRVTARERLRGLQEEFDAFGYIESLFAELSPLLAPNVLQALAEINPTRSVPLVRESAGANVAALRAMAIELMGRMRLESDVSLIARGLVDFDPQVLASAAYALATMKIRAATPALTGLLTHPNLRVSGAARQALRMLWAEELGEDPPTTVSEWTALYESQSGSDAPIQLAGLQPLSPEEEELKHSYDSNH